MPHLVKEKIRTIPDFPKVGIMFRDVTTLISDGDAFQRSINILAKRYIESDAKIDKIVGIESRGFIFGAALANVMGIGFIPIRKAGKLPGQVESVEYDLEYGKDKVEIHKDALQQGDNVLLIDDLLATGGTAQAACVLLERVGAKIYEVAFIVELPALGGRSKLKDYNIYAMVDFEGE